MQGLHWDAVKDPSGEVWAFQALPESEYEGLVEFEGDGVPVWPQRLEAMEVGCCATCCHASS